MITLTVRSSKTNERTIIIPIDRIICFESYEEGGTRIILSSGGGGGLFGPGEIYKFVKETPAEVYQLIKQARSIKL